MFSQDTNSLICRRQYVISGLPVDCPFKGISLQINKDYTLYYHPDLIVTEIEEGALRLILLGDIYDFRSPEYTNTDILKTLVALPFDALIEELSFYMGRFVLIIREGTNMRLVTDATAYRKVYYSKHEGTFLFASTPNIIASILNLHITAEPSKSRYYQSKDFIRLHNSNVGNTTIFDDVFQLIPNHFFDVNTGKTVRFFPNKKIEFQPVDEIAQKCADILKGYMQAVLNRYKIMIPLTSGKDSRLLLAATKDLKGDVLLYINKLDGWSDRFSDMRIPMKIAKSLGLNFKVMLDEGIDEDFKNIYFQNNKFASDKHLPFVYNYYKNYSDWINMPGNISAGGHDLFKVNLKSDCGEVFSKLYGLEQYEFASRYYYQWHLETKEIVERTKFAYIELFYWEERLANWGAQIQLEKDIAQEEINLYNSRLFITLFHSVKPKYMVEPKSILHKKIIKILWPELLRYPINPSFRNYLRLVMSHIGILGVVEGSLKLVRNAFANKN